MPAALTKNTYYFAIDAAYDLSTDEFRLSTSLSALATVGGGTIAAYVGTGAPLAGLPDAPVDKKKRGFRRYWWSLLIGQGQPVAPQVGRSAIYGRLEDNPNAPIYTWYITLPN
jgi:hypothetical protein